MSNRKVELAFASAMAILLFAAGLSYRSNVAAVESNRWVRHTYEVIGALQDLTLDMRTIESSARGFILTGNDLYLGDYRSSVLRVAQDQEAFGRLTIDNPVQQRKLPDLARLATAKVQLAERVIGIRRDQGFDATMDATRRGEGQRLTNEFLVVVDAAKSEELRLLAMRDTVARSNSLQAAYGLLIATILGLAITAAAGWSVQRDNRRREAVEKHLVQMEGRYRGLLEAAPDAMVVVNQGGEIVLLNVQAEKQFGYRRDELLGQKVTNIIPEGFAERLVADDLRSRGRRARPADRDGHRAHRRGARTAASFRSRSC